MSVIKVLSWNVEHFKTGKTQRIAEIIKGYDPDIFGIYEVESLPVYNFMVQYFQDYLMFITQGQQTQQILVAVKKTFGATKFEQKLEFQSGNPYLRPGAFLTFKTPVGEDFAFLFLHTDSGTTAVDFGNRTEMFERGCRKTR